MTSVDVVVVTFNSGRHVRAALEPLVHASGIAVMVVDNGSMDDTLATISDLPVTALPLERNRGFAYGCNRGWRRGSAPYVLFLNPDARIPPEAIDRLVEVARASGAGVVAPRIVAESGATEYSLRRFPRLRSTFAEALYLHRLAPHAAWSDELVRDEAAYEEEHDVEWVSGACLLVRRETLERIGGWDEGFFLYGEDVDLCRRVWDGGDRVRYVPDAAVVHAGGASTPRASLLPVLAASRLRYARKHRGRAATLGERLGVALGAMTHAVAARGGPGMRRGHLRALPVAFAPLRPGSPSG